MEEGAILKELRRLLRVGLRESTIRSTDLPTLLDAEPAEVNRRIEARVAALQRVDAHYELLDVGFALGEWSSDAPGDEGYRRRRLEILTRSGMRDDSDSDRDTLRRWDSFLRTRFTNVFLRPVAEGLVHEPLDGMALRVPDPSQASTDSNPVRARAHRQATERFSPRRSALEGAVFTDLGEERHGLIVDLLTVTETLAPRDVADELEILRTDKVIRRFRRYSLHGPFQIASAYIPLWVAREVPMVTRDMTGPGGIYARFREVFGGLQLTERLRFRIATSDEVQLLELDDGDGVVQIDRIARTAGRPVEFSRICARTDAYEFEYKWII